MSMQRSGKRDEILDVASRSVIEKGFAATSIEEIIADVGITKSGFFYHFADKNELAKALFQRYIDAEDQLFDELEKRAFELNEDPLHGFLINLKLLAELLGDLPNGHPGCLIASYCYQSQLFNAEIRQMNQSALRSWNTRFRRRLEEIAAVYPPSREVDLDELAQMLITIVEGAIITARAIGDPGVLPRQIMLYRDYVRSIFQP
jgi:AcrR family transcriptional regulator